MEKSNEQHWKEYVEHELSMLIPVLSAHGFVLSDDQPHIRGERFLMQAVTTTAGKKLILLGTRKKDGAKVVIKASREQSGIDEIEHERMLREKLPTLLFSYDTYHAPEEIFYVNDRGLVISIQKFIEQTSSFLERPVKEQFAYALRALKAQEATRLTTTRHTRYISRIFENYTTREYLTNFKAFIETVRTTDPEVGAAIPLLEQVYAELQNDQYTLDQYSGFLTHTDFVPHNIRIKDDTIYLLDFSSLRFGNKHESWARFLNFMTLYNPELEAALLSYVSNNRAPEENRSLHLMRLYRLGEIITYYVGTLEKSEGDLRTLNTARIHFWGSVLAYTLKQQLLPDTVRLEYIKLRDSLRSNDEKKRQVGLH